MKIKSYKLIWIAVLLLSAILHLILCISPAFADFFNSNIGHYVRLVLAKATGYLPFSLGETMLFLIPVGALAVTLYVNKKGGSILSRVKRAAVFLLCALITVYALFVLTLSAGYNTPSLDNKMGLDKNEVSAEDIYETAIYIIEKVNNTADKINFNKSGASDISLDHKDISSQLSDSYGKVFAEYRLGKSFNSTVKPLLISPLMTYTHVSGVYSFFTGEANINTNYPGYVRVFSSAHEMAHQRGISREDEANFIAYLICINSEDEYIRYSGYLSMYTYLISSLRNADARLYKDAVTKLGTKAKGELIAYSTFFDKYRDNPASAISDTVNDAYLKAQGTQGIRSYGLVTYMAVAFHRNDR